MNYALDDDKTDDGGELGGGLRKEGVMSVIVVL